MVIIKVLHNAQLIFRHFSQWNALEIMGIVAKLISILWSKKMTFWRQLLRVSIYTVYWTFIDLNAIFCYFQQIRYVMSYIRRHHEGISGLNIHLSLFYHYREEDKHFSFQNPVKFLRTITKYSNCESYSFHRFNKKYFYTSFKMFLLKIPILLVTVLLSANFFVFGKFLLKILSPKLLLMNDGNSSSNLFL